MFPDSNPMECNRLSVENQPEQSGDLRDSGAHEEMSLQKKCYFYNNREEYFKVLKELLSATEFQEYECDKISALHALFGAAQQTLKLCVKEVSEDLSIENKDRRIYKQSIANSELHENLASRTTNAKAVGECFARQIQSVDTLNCSIRKKCIAQESPLKDVAKVKHSVMKVGETTELSDKNVRIGSSDSSELNTSSSLSLKSASNLSRKSSESSNSSQKSSSKSFSNPLSFSTSKEFSAQESSLIDVIKSKHPDFKDSEKAALTVKNILHPSTDISISNFSSKSSSNSKSKLSSKSLPKSSSKYLSNPSNPPGTKKHSSHKSFRQDITKIKCSENKASEKAKLTVKNPHRRLVDRIALNSTSQSSFNSSSKIYPRFSSNPLDHSVTETCIGQGSSGRDATKTECTGRKTPKEAFEERADISLAASFSSAQASVGWARGKEGDPPFIYAGKTPRLILRQVDGEHYAVPYYWPAVSCSEEEDASSDAVMP